MLKIIIKKFFDMKNTEGICLCNRKTDKQDAQLVFHGSLLVELPDDNAPPPCRRVNRL